MISTAFVTLLSASLLGQTADPAAEESMSESTITTEVVVEEGPADDEPAEGSLAALLGIPDEDGLTNYFTPWKELRAALEENGLTLSVGMTSTFQFHSGGLNQNGTFADFWSFDVTLSLDFGKLLKIEALEGIGATIYMDQGYGDGANRNIGSIMGVNWDGTTSYGPYVAEYFLYIDKEVLPDLTVIGRLGKLCIHGGPFDRNEYAKDETSQFMASHFRINPFIEGGEVGVYLIGAEIGLEYSLKNVAPGLPITAFFIHSGVYAQNGRDTTFGLKEAFTTVNGDKPDVIWLSEFGFRTELPSWTGEGVMPGTYRFGFGYNSDEVEQYAYNNWGGILPAKFEKGYNFFYMSFDQMVFKENSDEDDTQGLGLFFRYGTTPESKALAPFWNVPIESFWSFGFQYQGLIPTRDQDVLGFGYALMDLNGYAQPRSSGGFAASSAPRFKDEQILEIYYKIQVFNWLSVTPDLQYVLNPGGQGTDDAVVAGVRIQVAF